MAEDTEPRKPTTAELFDAAVIAQYAYEDRRRVAADLEKAHNTAAAEAKAASTAADQAVSLLARDSGATDTSMVYERNGALYRINTTTRPWSIVPIKCVYKLDPVPETEPTA